MSRLSCSHYIRFASFARDSLLLKGQASGTQNAVQYGRQRLFSSGPSCRQHSSHLAPFHFLAAANDPLQSIKSDANVSSFLNVDGFRTKRSFLSQPMYHRSIVLSQASTSAANEPGSPQAQRPGGNVNSTLNPDPKVNKHSAGDNVASSTTSANDGESTPAKALSGSPGKSFGQNFNLAGIRITVGLLLGGKKHLGVPHVAVPDIRWIDWQALKAAGLQGVVFDKDNTMTVPYALHIHEPLEESLRECREVFEEKIVLLSNSAGLKQFDPDGTEAGLLERTLGIPVLRHGAKKPAGTADALISHFGCGADRLVMVGDRYFTDVVFGNRHGMLTIRPSPLTATGEPTMVKKVRLLEATLLSRWRAKGISAPDHPLAPAPGKFIKDPGCW